MKKVGILIMIVLFAFSMKAQRVNSFWGTAADTLTASVAKTQVIPIGTNEWKDFSITVFTDSVSGTPAYTAKLEYSLDGTNYHAITGVSNVTHNGGLDKSFAWQSKTIYTFTTAGDTTLTGTAVNHELYIDAPVMAKYLKVTLTATATAQKSLCYGYYIITAYKED
jgi:hypothetical protein